jgi:hypothetical protein
MGRPVLLSLLVALALVAAADAAAQRYDVVVDPPFTATLERFDGLGAVGLLVPDAGPSTSRERALASLVRGEVVNSLRGRLPAGEPRLSLRPGQGDAGTIYVVLPGGEEQRNDRRYPVAVAAAGADGLLTSRSTRIPGLVSVADVAPTALGEDGALGWTAHDDPVAYLRGLDQRIRDNGTTRLPASLLAAAIVVALALLRPRAAVGALATGALANLVLGVLGISEPWAAIPAIALGSLAGLLVRPTGPLLAGTIALYGLAMWIDAAWVALSPLGPTQNARFYGISNLLETLLLPIALGAGVLLWRRLGPAGLALAAAIALVTVAGSRFGADAGGAVVLLGGFAVLLAALLPRRAAAAALAALVLVTVLALVLGPSTHLGAADLPGDLWDRLTLSWQRATDGWAVAVVTAAALALLAVLVARGPRRPLPLAMAAAIAVSMIVNDSPQDVALGGLVGWLALARWDDATHVP